MHSKCIVCFHSTKEQLCGTEDLSHVTLLQICVDTQENTLGNFGKVYRTSRHTRHKLFLKFGIMCLHRDLGTALYHLQVLWMTRCSLRDLSGVSNFSSLKELYLAYNSISELSQVGMLENLQLLDLEGNDVDDLVQVQYLGLCGKLQTLILEGNPVCARPNPTATQVVPGYSYRAAVRELVPQLCYLDNLSLEESERHSSSTMGEDWVVLQTAIKDSKFLRAAAVGGLLSITSGFTCRQNPSEIFTPQCNLVDLCLCHSFLCLFTLLKGAGNTKLCGNPVRALRARREKLRVGGVFENKTPKRELETESATFKKKIIILCSNVKGTMGNATGSFILADIQHWCYHYTVLFFQPPV
uniref:Leucine rich repeat containing 56 n=1 Tax=Takifugu rubripes TaxID=31033 RepID=H2TUQ4_TAKRU